MTCTCTCDDFGDTASVYNERYPRARRQHICCECNSAIEPGERYHYFSGCWDGSWSTFETCLVCEAIRAEVCPNGYEFGMLRQTIWYCHDIDYITGEERVEKKWECPL